MENNVVWSKKDGDWVEKEGKKDIKGYVPSQISSIILSKLKDYTSGVKKAVVTVPAMFAQTARDATLDAAKLAKLPAPDGVCILEAFCMPSGLTA